jgi:hypothetical protein
VRRPLRASPDSLQASRGVSGLDRDMPSISKYSDLVGSRTAAVSAEISGPIALERNVTSSTASHYAAGSDGPDSARGTSSGLSSGSTMLRPSSASAVLMSDKTGAPSALSSLAAANTAYASSAAAADYLARRASTASTANAYSTSGTNVYSTIKTMPINAMSNLPSSVPEPSVAAPFSGAGSTTPTKRLSKQLETMELGHDTDTAALRQTDSRAAIAPTVPRGVGDGEDQLSLQSMHSNISAVLVHVPPSSSSATKKEPPTSYLPLPSVWVSRWVDYSKKYGLGYKLSNGSSGVFFNDATKMILETDGDSLGVCVRVCSGMGVYVYLFDGCRGVLSDRATKMMLDSEHDAR